MKPQAGLGLDFLAEVERTARRIQQNPRIGAPYKATGFRRCPVTRFPYGIFYLELEAHLWIASVAHAKRTPDYWKTRKAE